MNLLHLNKQLNTIQDLKNVVSTMKLLSSVGVGQYEKVQTSLTQYTQTILDAFHGLFIQEGWENTPQPSAKISHNKSLIIVLGTDTGLVGKYNRDLAEYTHHFIQDRKLDIQLLCVGKRLTSFLTNTTLKPKHTYANINSVHEIATLSEMLLTKVENWNTDHHFDSVFIIYNQRDSSTYKTTYQQIFPLSENLLQKLAQKKWAGKSIPLVTADTQQLFASLIHEYLLMLFANTITNSVLCENYVRMLHMQQSEKNIEEKLNALTHLAQQARQNQITEELIDVISGANAIKKAFELDKTKKTD